MHLYFEPTGRPAFSRKVRPLETIQQVKKKIQKFKRIPAERQTLIFETQTLTDDLMICETGIINNSNIQLIIAQDQEGMPSAPGHLSPPPPPPPPLPPQPQPLPLPEIKKISIMCRHSSFFDQNSVEVEENDTIQGLKNKIRDAVHKGITVETVRVRSDIGVELHDHNTLRECGLIDQSVVEVYFKKSPKDILVTILYGTETIQLEVNEWDLVGELRNKLKQMNQWQQLNLSEEGAYYFRRTVNQYVMEEDLSWASHRFLAGETIEIVDIPASPE